MDELLDITKALISPTEKLIDAARAAIGTMYEPTRIRKLADARAYEIASVGQAMRESCDIPIHYNQGALTMDTTDSNELITRTQKRFSYQEIVKQINIENVLAQAYTLLEDKPPVENDPIDHDWLLRFFNSVQDISNEEMQQLWAKVLAGEVNHPKSISLRTLSILKQLSPKEAQTFTTLLKYMLHCKNDPESLPDDYFIVGGSDALNIANLAFSDIFFLDEAGLISSNSAISVGFNVAPYHFEFIYWYDTPVIKIYNTGKEDVGIIKSAFLLTTAGKELLTVIKNDTYEIPTEYIHILEKEFRGTYPNFIEISLCY